MTLQPVEQVCWSCNKVEDINNQPENPFVMTAEHETPHKPFTKMHDKCRGNLDLLVWTRE